LRNTNVLAIVLALSSLPLAAQSASPTPQSGAPANLPWDQTAITGCLETSMGRYTLTEEDGTRHDLSGSGRKLKPYVGHEVELTGKKSTRTIDATAPGGPSSAIEKPIFEVKVVKSVADKCTSQADPSR